MNLKKMIEKFLCPGCVCGSDPDCGRFTVKGLSCGSHVAGTIMMPGGKVALGLPKGFCKLIDVDGNQLPMIRLHAAVTPTEEYNDLNVPVWYLEQDGFLFLKVFSPRTLFCAVDVYPNRRLRDVVGNEFNPIDVGKFIDEID